MRSSKILFSASKGLNAIIFGSPGSGKGTISKKIVKDFSFNHISTGDLLRQNVLDGTPLGVAAKEIMDAGGLVPDKLVLDMLLEHSKKKQNDTNNSNKNMNLLLDGYPRTIGQANSLQEHFPIDTVIALDVPHQTIIDRLSSRWIHPQSGRTYAYDYNPPKVLGFDDETNEPLIQRDDDKPESIAARLQGIYVYNV